ncbi:hypothetical protein electrica_04493 [Klebsiella electrica]|nr:hypothetical protein electrica_04493 [Klebsiella electrica]
MLLMSSEEIAMRKARFTEHQIIAVLKSVETGRTVIRPSANTRNRMNNVTREHPCSRSP